MTALLNNCKVLSVCDINLVIYPTKVPSAFTKYFPAFIFLGFKIDSFPIFNG